MVNIFKKTFGIWPLVLYTAMGIFLCVAFSVKGGFAGFLLAILFVYFKALAVTPVFRITGDAIIVRYLVPFKKKTKLKINTLTKVIFEVAYRESDILFLTGDGQIKINTAAPAWAVKKLYNYLLSIGLNVESAGSGAFTWHP